MKISKEKINEIIRYLIVGVLTTIVSLGIYYGLVFTILNPENPAELQIANILSWVGAVIFAYITNRIFVFKSHNQNHLKEITNFVGSRLLTLFLDMAIMFLGVTILKQNDKLIKIVSQVAITVSNYFLSKWFVFNKKEKSNLTFFKNKDNFLLIGLFIFPLLFLLEILFPNNNIINLTNKFYKIIFFLIASIYLFFTKKNQKTIILIYSIIIVSLLYSYCKFGLTVNFIDNLCNILYLPLCLILFNNIKYKKINHSFIAKMFYVFLIIYLIFIFTWNKEMTFEYYSLKKEMLMLLTCLLPIVLNVLKQHKNYLAKFLGISLILITMFISSSLIFNTIFAITIIYLIWQSKNNLKNEKVFLISSLILIALSFCILLKPNIFLESNFKNKYSYINEINYLFRNSNIDEQIFGMANIYNKETLTTPIDLMNILYNFGYIGIFAYVLIISISISKIRLKREYTFPFIICFLLSFINANILNNYLIGIFLPTLILVFQNNSIAAKKILLVSNMYPSKKFKHYGSFVKNVKEELEKIAYQVDMAVKKKNVSFPTKFIGYSLMYIKAITKSIFTSYDYYYVHFVSQSTFSVLLGKITGNTKLVCNVHGNDIVPDYEFEKKNVSRSKKVLPFADRVVAPSKYFAEVLNEKYHISKDKIFIYPSGGINFEIFGEKSQEECQKILNLDSKYFYIGMVSRIEKDKGWDTLLEAINILKKESFMQKTKVIIIGTGNEQELMTKKIKDLKLEKYIIQKDFVLQKDLVNYYNAFDLFIFPTKRKSESLGLVGLEAMACQTPLIVCDLYGPKEYAKNKINCLTYQKDGQELAKKIKQFVKISKDKLLEMQKNEFITAKKYDAKKIIEQIEKIFKD